MVNSIYRYMTLLPRVTLLQNDAKHQNKMPNPVPKYGPSGIGNFFNTYTWTMGVGFKKTPAFASLLVGTFDWSYVLEQMLITLAMQQGGANPAIPGITLDPEMLEEFMDQLHPTRVSVQTCLWLGVLMNLLFLSQMMEWGITLTMVFAPCFPLNLRQMVLLILQRPKTLRIKPHPKTFATRPQLRIFSTSGWPIL